MHSEVERLAALFRQRQGPVTMLLTSAASERSLDTLSRSGDLGSFRYLHLATHGLRDRPFLLRSPPQLSQDCLPDTGQQLAAWRHSTAS